MRLSIQKCTSLLASVAGTIIFVTCLAASGQSPPVKNTLIQDLATTFGFCYGQRRSLAQISERFPDLEAQTMLAQMKWENAFMEAETGIETRLKSLAPQQWEEARAKLIEQMEPMLKQQASHLTREAAIKFLDVVQQRAKGVLDSPNREMLLASNPKFIQAPVLEFGAGYTGTFCTKGHPKAKGVELTIRYPLSWKQRDGDRPNIIQKWTSDGGHGTDLFIIQVRNLPAVPSAQEVEAMFTPSFANEMFEADGKVVSYTTGRLEKLPLGIAHFTQTVKRLDVTFDIHGVFYYLIHENAFISLQFMCFTRGDENARDARFKQIEPLSRAIVNSLVLPANYK